jgi:small-conductance mechanosensitive channel
MWLMPAWHTLQTAATGFTAALPAVGGGAVVLAIAWLVAGSADRLVFRLVRRAAHQPSLAQALGNITKFVVVMVGFLIAATLIFPSVKPVDILSFLGFGGVAVGFAFKDIFQNFLAGMLLLLRQPFRLGDVIRVGANEGVVEDISLRSTVLATPTGERVILPNSDVYSQPVVVRTAHGRRRSSVVVPVPATEDLEAVKQRLAQAVAGVEGVLPTPAPLVVARADAPAASQLEVYYWTLPEEAEVLTVTDRVAIAARRAAAPDDGHRQAA